MLSYSHTAINFKRTKYLTFSQKEAQFNTNRYARELSPSGLNRRKRSHALLQTVFLAILPTG